MTGEGPKPMSSENDGDNGPYQDYLDWLREADEEMRRAEKTTWDEQWER